MFFLVFFYRDSLVLTAVLLFGTVIARGISKFEIIAPQWIEILNNLLITNPVGMYFDMDSFEDKTLNNSIGDNEHLVNNKQSIVSKENIKWRQFAKIVDRLLFVIFILSYALIYIRLVPLGY